MSSEATKSGKTIDLSIEIDATPEQVWEAISQAEGLKRWFPLDAGVTPGEGGSMTWSWGEGCEGTAEISAWEEGSHIQLIERPASETTAPILTDFRIETRSGKTVLRLVNSGFDPGEEWADYVDTLDSGWRYFLWNLKHYLERHPATPRRMVWSREKSPLSKDEAWRRLLGPGGLAKTTARPSVGDPVTLWSGHKGRVQQVRHPIHFAAVFPDLNDAILFLEFEPGTTFHLGVWLSLYGVEEEQALQLETSLGATLAAFKPVQPDER